MNFDLKTTTRSSVAAPGSSTATSLGSCGSSAEGLRCSYRGRLGDLRRDLPSRSGSSPGSGDCCSFFNSGYFTVSSGSIRSERDQRVGRRGGSSLASPFQSLPGVTQRVDCFASAEFLSEESSTLLASLVQHYSES